MFRVLQFGSVLMICLRIFIPFTTVCAYIAFEDMFNLNFNDPVI